MRIREKKRGVQRAQDVRLFGDVGSWRAEARIGFENPTAHLTFWPPIGLHDKPVKLTLTPSALDELLTLLVEVRNEQGAWTRTPPTQASTSGGES